MLHHHKAKGGATYACSKPGCALSTIEKNDAEAQRTLDAVNAEAEENARFLALKDEIMRLLASILPALEAHAAMAADFAQENATGRSVAIAQEASDRADYLRSIIAKVEGR